MVDFSVIWPSAMWYLSGIALKADTVNVISQPAEKLVGTAAAVGKGRKSVM